MKFVDYVTISVRSGKGGAGSVSFRSEKYAPKGGPDGGDGGQGGSVIVVGDAQLYTLLDLRYNRHHFAEKGDSGSSANKTGKNGEDIVLRVPVGTVIKDAETKEIVGEVLEAGHQIVLAKGGRGGKGNAFFKSSTNQSPRYSQPGEMGEEREITMELKLLADVGLVGLPNAGKSTLVSSLSAARPKIADYPFTTLVPSLGVVSVGAYESFVMADIPGIIEGANEGKGLGIRFLKHIERNAVLLFLIPVTEPDHLEAYATLLGELRKFNPDLLNKPRMVALTKTDLLPPEERLALERKEVIFEEGVSCWPISSVARFGLEGLRHALWEKVQAERSEAIA